MLVTDASVGRVLGGAQIVQEKNRESFLLSKNVCWCWLRMLLLAEYVPATMLDPKALGTAFQKKKNKRSEWNCTSSPSLNNAADYKGGGVASPQASWYLARHRCTRSWHGTAWDIPASNCSMPLGVHNNFGLYVVIVAAMCLAIQWVNLV